jgi:hypothetical protein
VLAIHLLMVGTSIRRVRLVTSGVHVLTIIVLHRLLYAGRRWCRIGLLLRRITDRRQLNLARAGIRSGRLVAVRLWLFAVLLGCSLSLALPLLFGLPLDFLLLLTLLPLFANLFELCDKAIELVSRRLSIQSQLGSEPLGTPHHASHKRVALDPAQALSANGLSSCKGG